MSAPGRDGFGRLLRAEWTKLRTVTSMAWCLIAAVGIIVAFAVLISSGNPGTYDRAAYVDEFRFVHRSLTGDGTLLAHVRAQDSRHPWAMAGIMVKQSPTPGAPYAALLVTPGHGVRMQADFTTDIAGGARTAPRWLKLERRGGTVTGYESSDGTTWAVVGTVRVAALAPRVEVGVFVTSPGMTRVQPMRPTLIQTRPSTATFDAVRLTAAAPEPPTAWHAQDVGRRGGPVPEQHDGPGPNGVITVTGSGDIIGQTDDGSRIIAATAGTLFGVLPLVALGALVMTSEYRPNTIWATLAASPRRGRLLAAKAVVLGFSTFAAGLIAAIAALLLSQPLLRRHGYDPPTYPDPSLFDPTVMRVVVGTATFLALLALLSLGLGTILRRSAGAITVVATTVLLPVIITPFLPVATGRWLQRLTPIAGLSLQQVRETDDALLLPWAGRPWTGFAVLCAYTSAALVAGYWLLRRADA